MCSKKSYFCSTSEQAKVKEMIRNNLKSVMMTVDLEEVTSKYVSVFSVTSLLNHDIGLDVVC